MNGSSSRIAGCLAVAVGVVAILAFLFLVMFLLGEFTHGSRLIPFGSINDALIGLVALLSAGLAWALYPLHRTQSPAGARLGLVAAFLGVPFAIVGSFLVVSGTTDYLQAGHYTFIGYGVMGAWLLVLNDSAGRYAAWSSHLIRLGLTAGCLMMVGLLGGFGIAFDIDAYNAPSWFVAVEGLAFLGWGVLYPVWCILLGRFMLGEISAQS